MNGERFIHDDRFVESFHNRDHVVLGRRLDPYCLWHHFNLEVAQSPVLLDDPLDPLSLLMAVRVCTTPWTQQHRPPDLREPGLIKFMWQAGRYNFRAELEKFRAYFKDYNQGPKMWPNQHTQEDGETPPDRDFDANLELALYLAKTTSLTWPELWTMPLGMLHWNSVGISKLEGAKIMIWTPEHEEMFAKHKEQREAKIDERGKVIAEELGIPFLDARKMAHDEHWAAVKEAYGHAKQSTKHPRQQR